MTKIKTKMTSLMSGASALGFRMSPAERAMGRLMRSPDEHAAAPAAGADGGSEAAPDADAAAAAAAADAAPADKQVTGSDTGADEGDKGKGADADAGADEGSIAGGAGADKGEADKTADIIGAPEAYDIKLPEALATAGMTFDKEVFDLVEPELRDMNLSNAAAQRLAAVYAEKVIPALKARAEKDGAEAQQQAAAQIRKGWADEARADAEIGGANFDKTVDACAAVWGKFGIKKGEGIRQLLDDSGLGNHPDMLRFLSRVATATGEGSYIPSDAAGSDARPIWDRVYGQPEPAK